MYNIYFTFRQQHNMILSYFNILAVALIYNLSKNMTEDIHLDIIMNQVCWISALFKKCGAQIEVPGKLLLNIHLHNHNILNSKYSIYYKIHY